MVPNRSSTGTWRSLIAVALIALLVAAPVASVLLHVDHDGPECAACKLAAQALVADAPRTSLALPPARQCAAYVDIDAVPRDAQLGNRPSRAPPA
jgi:hypothetical protein